MKKRKYNWLKKMLMVAMTVHLCFAPYSVYATEITDLENGNVMEATVNGYLDIGDMVDFYQPVQINDALLKSGALPAQYDGRNKGIVSSVKNQNPYGTCWAFSAIGAAESQMLLKGSGEPDYSELQLLYFAFHHVDDPLKNLAGDSTSSSGYLTYGSTNTSTMFALSSWIGIGNETIAPYELVQENSSAELSSSLAYQDELHLQNTYMISMKNADAVKSLILEYGSVVSGIRMDTGSICYNESTDSLFQNTDKSANHSILIVGWNDDYSNTNFVTDNQPASNGAWLIKNSWGTTNKPFIWVSYEDLCITNQNAYAYDFADGTQYDFNYQYDGSLSTHHELMENGSTLVNVFSASGADRERIRAVSFATRSDNVSYSIQIYKNSGPENPLGGAQLLETPVTGMTTFAGYYTIDLEPEVIVDYGDSFSIAITLTDTDNSYVDYYADTSGNNSGIVFYENCTASGQSYIYENGCLKDLSEQTPDSSNGNPSGTGYTARIKAFTTIEEKECIDINDSTFFIVSKQNYTGREINPTITVTYEGEPLKKGTDYKVSFLNNINIGTATAVVEGIGDYTGTKKLSFSIMARVKPVTVYNGVDYSGVYDYNYYIKRHPGIWKAFGTDDKKTLEFFVKTGMKNGHQAISSFQVDAYACRYYDLRKLYKNDLEQYYIHYIKYGKKGGRIATGTTMMNGGPTVYNGVNYKLVFDVGYYANRYPYLRQLYGYDDWMYLKHFVNKGMDEGRIGNAAFHVNHYRSRYSDLRTAYASDLKKYYLHYIRYGYDEGRNGK